MSSIILHQFGSVSVGFDDRDGFIDATAMASAYKVKTGKRREPQDWARTKQAQEFINAVSKTTGIPVVKLTVIKEGRGGGTWIHPDLAIAFASWLSPEYQIIVTRVMQDWHRGKTLNPYPSNIVGELPKSPTEELMHKATVAINTIFHDVAPELRKGMIIEGVCNVDPSLRPILEPHKPKLLLDAPLLNPTELGQLMDPPLSARAVNKLLCDRNLQEPTGEKNPAYRLIGSGHEFGKVVADTARGHGKTVQHVRWYESIIGQLL